MKQPKRVNQNENFYSNLCVNISFGEFLASITVDRRRKGVQQQQQQHFRLTKSLRQDERGIFLVFFFVDKIFFGNKNSATPRFNPWPSDRIGWDAAKSSAGAKCVRCGCCADAKMSDVWPDATFWPATTTADDGRPSLSTQHKLFGRNVQLIRRFFRLLFCFFVLFTGRSCDDDRPNSTATRCARPLRKRRSHLAAGKVTWLVTYLSRPTVAIDRPTKKKIKGKV